MYQSYDETIVFSSIFGTFPYLLGIMLNLTVDFDLVFILRFNENNMNVLKFV